MDRIVGEIVAGVERLGLADDTAIVLLSEYAMTDVSRPVLLNRELRKAGLLAVREIGGREYLDAELSTAFAMVDHQMAHVFVNGREPDELARVRAVLEAIDGVERVLDRAEQAAYEIDHPSSGDLDRDRRGGRLVRLLLVAGRRIGAAVRPRDRHPPQAGLRPGRAVLRSGHEVDPAAPGARAGLARPAAGPGAGRPA